MLNHGIGILVEIAEAFKDTEARATLTLPGAYSGL